MMPYLFHSVFNYFEIFNDVFSFHKAYDPFKYNTIQEDISLCQKQGDIIACHQAKDKSLKDANEKFVVNSKCDNLLELIGAKSTGTF